MAAKLIERGSLHREQPPVGIGRGVGAGENVERLLEITIVGERPAIAAEHRLVAGNGDGGLLEHGYGLGALAAGAQRVAIAERGVGILGIGAIALRYRGSKEPGKTGLLTHGTLTHGIKRIDRAERASNRLLTLTSG
jgi:hypothetical protein